jgi:hypothetical protein
VANGDKKINITTTKRLTVKIGSIMSAAPIPHDLSLCANVFKTRCLTAG